MSNSIQRQPQPQPQPLTTTREGRTRTRTIMRSVSSCNIRSEGDVSTRRRHQASRGTLLFFKGYLVFFWLFFATAIALWTEYLPAPPPPPYLLGTTSKASTTVTTVACPDFSQIMRNPPLPKTSSSSSSKSCYQTKHFPFLTGCPEQCPSRNDTVEGEPLYRMTLEWYFGEPDQYPLPNGVSTTTYDKGINFQCPDHFVKTFQDSSTWLYSSLLANMPNTTGKLILKKQRRMHLSLSYL